MLAPAGTKLQELFCACEELTLSASCVNTRRLAMVAALASLLLVASHLGLCHTDFSSSKSAALCCAVLAGVIALDLAKELLELHPNKIAMVVSHENITNNYYTGKDRGML